MSLTSPKNRIPVRLLAVAGSACALIGLTVGAPRAMAATETAAASPIECQFTSHATASPVAGNPDGVTFATTGPITCDNPSTGKQVLHGTEALVGTISHAACSAPDSGATATLAVNWSDGTTSSGTLTSFQGRTVDGTAVLGLYGTNDPDSTQLAGYSIALNALVLGLCGTPDGGDVDVTVAYLPPQP